VHEGLPPSRSRSGELQYSVNLSITIDSPTHAGCSHSTSASVSSSPSSASTSASTSPAHHPMEAGGGVSGDSDDGDGGGGLSDGATDYADISRPGWLLDDEKIGGDDTMLESWPWQDSSVCQECLQSLQEAPINSSRNQRKKPVSQVQKERTQRLYKVYLRDYKNSTACEKAAYIFANFTLCGGFKRLRQLVGYHNKSHTTRSGATKITRLMDSKLQVLKECAADNSIPLWLFLNAKKPNSDGTPRKPAPVAKLSSSYGPVRKTTEAKRKNRKRLADPPYP